MREYSDLVNALKATDIPFAEYAWKARPEGTYGVITPDFEAGTITGDGMKADRSTEVSVDLFFEKLTDQDTLEGTIETVLLNCCGDSWELSSRQHESETGQFHIEWVCEVFLRTAGGLFPTYDAAYGKRF